MSYFENGIVMLMMAMKQYNSCIADGDIPKSLTAFATYNQTKHCLSVNHHDLEIETTPVDCSASVNGKNFIFTKLTMAPEYADKYPVLKTMGFKTDTTGVFYEFKQKGW